jgi:PadR family transcriptional regulator PadR
MVPLDEPRSSVGERLPIPPLPSYCLRRLPSWRPLDNGKISSYRGHVPPRKPGTLLPIETEILEVALSMLRSGHATFHGFGLAQTMRDQSGSRSLTAHGTLYKALGRLEEFGLVTSRWEDAAAVEGRPRRRLYELTGQGINVAERALAGEAAARSSRPASKPA